MLPLTVLSPSSLSPTAFSKPSWTSSWLASWPKMVTPASRSESPPPGPRSSSWPPEPRTFWARRAAESANWPPSFRRGSASPRDPSSSTLRRSPSVVCAPLPRLSPSDTSSSEDWPSEGKAWNTFQVSRHSLNRLLPCVRLIVVKCNSLDDISPYMSWPRC